MSVSVGNQTVNVAGFSASELVTQSEQLLTPQAAHDRAYQVFPRSDKIPVPCVSLETDKNSTARSTFNNDGQD